MTLKSFEKLKEAHEALVRVLRASEELQEREPGKHVNGGPLDAGLEIVLGCELRELTDLISVLADAPKEDLESLALKAIQCLNEHPPSEADAGVN